MKKALLITAALIGLLAIAAFAYDAATAKPERAILVDESYDPSAPPPKAMPPSALRDAAPAADDLTPLSGARP